MIQDRHVHPDRERDNLFGMPLSGSLLIIIACQASRAQMIQQETYMYYLAYVVSVAFLGLAYIRLQSLQKVLITTKEFKAFQQNFLLGYVPLLLVELLYLAFFLYVLLSNGMELSAAAKLFVGTFVHCG